MKFRHCTLSILILALVFFGQRPSAAAGTTEPGVARVSLIQGEVSSMRGDSGDEVAVAVNTPLVQGDKVSTDQQSRTEIQLDHANVLRLDQNTRVTLADLSRARIQVQVAQGLVGYTVLTGNEAGIEIDTPNVAIHPLHEGSFRLQVVSESETQFVVRDGEAEVSTSQGSTRVQKNQIITIQGSDNPQYQVARAPEPDEWDQWNRDRDRTIQDAQSWSHTDRYYTGAYELDSHGHWAWTPGYGWVWSPNVDPLWAPYRSGRWTFEPYWGWTWVSYEPWGWAPYHYGRWFFQNSAWWWWPGPVTPAYRPLWAPAYVSFFGLGLGIRPSSFGYHSIGWLPVGPGDYFYPWYGRGRAFSAVNITGITRVRSIANVNGAVSPLVTPGSRYAYSNVRAVLTDDRVRQAVTRVSENDFVRGRVSQASRAVSAEAIRRAQFVTGTIPAVPTRQSLRSADRPVHLASSAVRTSNTDRFFTLRQTPPSPHSFNSRAAEIQRMMQTPGQAQTITGQARDATIGGRPAVAGTQPGRTTVPRKAVNPQRPFASGQAENRPTPRDPATSPSQFSGSRPGAPTWRHFGENAPNGSSSATPPAAGNRSSFQSPSSNSFPNDRQGEWHHFTPSAQRPAERQPQNFRQPEYSRPPLEIHRPIVSERQPQLNPGRSGHGSWQGQGHQRSGR